MKYVLLTIGCLCTSISLGQCRFTIKPKGRGITVFYGEKIIVSKEYKNIFTVSTNAVIRKQDRAYGLIFSFSTIASPDKSITPQYIKVLFKDGTQLEFYGKDISTFFDKGVTSKECIIHLSNYQFYKFGAIEINKIEVVDDIKYIVDISKESCEAINLEAKCLVEKIKGEAIGYKNEIQ